VDLFTMVYVAVDDYLQHSLEHHRFVLPDSRDQKASYSKLMTISLMGDLLAEPYSGDWFVWVKHEDATLFPSLPCRCQEERTVGYGLQAASSSTG